MNKTIKLILSLGAAATLASCGNNDRDFYIGFLNYGGGIGAIVLSSDIDGLIYTPSSNATPFSYTVTGVCGYGM